MIEISNLRLLRGDEWTKVVVDIKSDVERVDKEDTMWVAVKNEEATMLNDENYDAFLCLPVYMAMYYNTDLRIHGCVSNVLYHNVQRYVQSVLKYFKDGMKEMNIIVDGFKEVEKKGAVVGTGISCGVDCLQTLYDNYYKEEDEEYKVNRLFIFNCGWNGWFYDKNTYQYFIDCANSRQNAAKDLKLPISLVDSNLHAFLHHLGDRSSYFNLYTCAFALEKGLSKYYISSSYSYRDVLRIGYNSRNIDFSEFGDPIVIPLLRSKGFELISDGCQYDRTEKTERIVDWEITKKHLNVCCHNDNKENCSVCGKCIRTLLALEAMDKLDDYKDLFNIVAYKKKSFLVKCKMVLTGKDGKDGFLSDLYRFYKQKNVKTPPYIIALIVAMTYLWPLAAINRIKRILKITNKYKINQ